MVVDADGQPPHLRRLLLRQSAERGNDGDEHEARGEDLQLHRHQVARFVRSIPGARMINPRTVCSFVMPTKVGIHDLSSYNTQSRSRERAPKSPCGNARRVQLFGVRYEMSVRSGR